MTKSGTRHRRSRFRPSTAWLSRALLATALSAGAYVSIAQTAAFAMRKTSSARAVALWPFDGRVLAIEAAKFAASATSPADRQLADRLAWKALRYDPMSVQAVTTLAIDAEARGETAKAKLLLLYAERLSRRDLQTEVGLIEYKVANGDVRGALRHYDIALRTSPTAGAILFPVLANALADPLIRTELASTLLHRPIWSRNFFEYLIGQTKDARLTAAFLLDLEKRGIPLESQYRTALIQGLLGQSYVKEAWRLYASSQRKLSPDRARDLKIPTADGTASAFDWTAVNDAGATVALTSKQGHPAAEFSAPTGLGGAVLRQIQIFPAGRYLISGHTAGIDQPTATRPYWVLNCQDGREVGRIVVPNSAVSGGFFKGVFDVPANCPTQTLVFVAPPSDSAAGSSGSVDRIKVEPVK